MTLLINNQESLITHISEALANNFPDKIFTGTDFNLKNISSVLLPLCMKHIGNGRQQEPCLILNKRSENVQQSGDLCCPGGGIKPRLDHFFALLLSLPCMPMSHQSLFFSWRKNHPEKTRKIALLFATGLRESFEEMRLNPFRVKLLGPLLPLYLQLSNRTLFSFVCWVSKQKKFIPNQEVEKIITIPIKKLLEPSCYARYKLRITPELETVLNQMPDALSKLKEDYPCFVHEDKNGKEVLWGATYRIVISFLTSVFGFVPPELGLLPAVYGTLDVNYYSMKEKK